MDGTFLGTYEKKISEWEIKINDDPENSKKYENEMNSYMAQCLPYLIKYTGYNSVPCQSPNTEKTIDIFNVKSVIGIRRREIYYEYLRDVENYKGSFPKVEKKKDKKKMKMNGNYNDNLILECKSCKSQEVFYDSLHSDNVCTNCGVVENILGEELTYKEEQEQHEKMVTQCGYKKENHLNEWILQFQGREATNIPQDVIDQLRSEFKKQKVKKVNEITREKVRQLLKKLKLAKYYEHSTHITHLLNGLKPPEMSQELEDRLRLMFKEIQDPFHKHCPRERNNFLSYSYVLYKFCELLEEDSFLPFFPLLKSKEKLHHQDVIWRKICGELQWEYIPTI
jgi:hypothetical protein